MLSDLTFSAAFLGTFFSVTFLSFLSYKEHNPDQPRSFSRLVAQRRALVNYFRVASVVCSSLCAITMYGLVIPNVHYSSALFVWWSIFYASELLSAAFPERGPIEKQLHSFFAYTMGLALLVTAVLLALGFTGGYRQLEIGVIAGMLILAALTQLDKRRFIFYELAFIYSSHVSILIAAITARNGI